MTTTKTGPEPLAYRINELHLHAPWGRSTTYKLAREGLIPTRKIGGATYVLRSDLVTFLHSVPTAQAGAA